MKGGGRKVNSFFQTGDELRDCISAQDEIHEDYLESCRVTPAETKNQNMELEFKWNDIFVFWAFLFMVWIICSSRSKAAAILVQREQILIKILFKFSVIPRQSCMYSQWRKANCHWLYLVILFFILYYLFLILHNTLSGKTLNSLLFGFAG